MCLLVYHLTAEILIVEEEWAVDLALVVVITNIDQQPQHHADAKWWGILSQRSAPATEVEQLTQCSAMT
jgi:hypothetical protein